MIKKLSAGVFVVLESIVRIPVAYERGTSALLATTGKPAGFHSNEPTILERAEALTTCRGQWVHGPDSPGTGTG